MFVVSQLFDYPIPRSVPGIYALILLILLSGIRFGYQGFILNRKKFQKNVLIFGVGEVGVYLLNSLTQVKNIS